VGSFLCIIDSDAVRPDPGRATPAQELPTEAPR
jgi:hypothetical protein